MKLYRYFICFFLLVQTSFATNYYCDPVHGKLTNDGSENNPWGSLESLFKKGMKFNPGDVVFLLSGNHGHVKVVGNNQKYINVKGAKGHNPVVNSLVFGDDNASASKWIFSRITFKEGTGLNTIYIHKNSTKIRLIENDFIAQKVQDVAIDIQGTQCKIESNTITHYSNGVRVSGEKNQIRNNRISFFSNNAIEVFGSYNLFEYNLIKESVALDLVINNAIYLSEKETKNNIYRGNTIINFSEADRENVGVLNGIYGVNTIVSENIFENNVIVSNGENGILLNGDLNNLKIVNNTVVNPYFGLQFKEKDSINSHLAIKLQGKNTSSNLIVRNNLSNNLLFENVKGVADHNLTLPVSVHDYDACFKNWALFDFSLSKNSIALNKGTSEMAPSLDASLNKRSLGSFINIGAFEYTKIDESNEVFNITAQISDRQLHSKGKGDWDGQSEIRVGGVAEKRDGAGLFPFKLPTIPGGKEIVSANFKVYLSKIDNNPSGGIDLYGLPAKSNFWVTEDMYYQGTYGQDVLARPIQNNFVDANTYTGEVVMSNVGKQGLRDYLNTVLKGGSKPGDYAFLRINSNVKDVADFNRWNFISANGQEKDKLPTLEITVGYPELNHGTQQPIKSVSNTIVVAPNPINHGDLTFYLLGFKENKKVHIKLLNYFREQVFVQTINTSNLTDEVYRTKNLKLPIGQYILECATGAKVTKQILFVW